MLNQLQIKLATDLANITPEEAKTAFATKDNPTGMFTRPERIDVAKKKLGC